MLEVRETETFSKWLRDLSENRAKAKIAARARRLAFGNPGDVRPVGEGICELRVNYGPGYRVYFVQRGEILIILLCGGDKSTQEKDIRLAKKAGCGGEMKALKTKPFDPADYLDNDEAIAAYMTEALETGDSAFVSDALGVVARARGMTEVARAAGVSRESLYRALSGEGSPKFETVLRVMDALGLKFSARPVRRKRVA